MATGNSSNIGCGEPPTMDMNALGPMEFACGPIYALELAMNNHARYIKTRADVVIVWFHWCLLRNGFYFFGGELTHNDFHSETLPPNLGFNGDRRAYVLKYGKGVMPYVVGLYIRTQGVDISFVSLYRSLRLNIGIEDLVDECLNLQDDVVQQLTLLVDEELIKPMQMDDGNGDPGIVVCPDDAVDCQPDAAKASEAQTNRDVLPQTLVTQQRTQSVLTTSSNRAVQTDGSRRAEGPQTLIAVSDPTPFVMTRNPTPFSRGTSGEKYKINRGPTPRSSTSTVSRQNVQVTKKPEKEDPDREGTSKGFTGCCG